MGKGNSIIKACSGCLLKLLNDASNSYNWDELRLGCLGGWDKHKIRMGTWLSSHSTRRTMGDGLSSHWTMRVNGNPVELPC